MNLSLVTLPLSHRVHLQLLQLLREDYPDGLSKLGCRTGSRSYLEDLDLSKLGCRTGSSSLEPNDLSKLREEEAEPGPVLPH